MLPESINFSGGQWTILSVVGGIIALFSLVIIKLIVSEVLNFLTRKKLSNMDRRTKDENMNGDVLKVFNDTLMKFIKMYGDSESIKTTLEQLRDDIKTMKKMQSDMYEIIRQNQKDIARVGGFCEGQHGKSGK